MFKFETITLPAAMHARRDMLCCDVGKRGIESQLGAHALAQEERFICRGGAGSAAAAAAVVEGRPCTFAVFQRFQPVQSGGHGHAQYNQQHSKQRDRPVCLSPTLHSSANRPITVYSGHVGMPHC